MQWIWKVGALAACVFQLAAAVVGTVVVRTRRVGIEGAGGSEGQVVREEWEGMSLVYWREGRAVATVVSAWVVWGLVVWR